MATFKKFEDIEAWQKARVLDTELYEISCSGKLEKDFTLKDQIRRSAGSIMDNIAEGFERGGKKEFVHFLSISKGSAGELRSQLYRTLDRKYITQTQFEKFHNSIVEISKMLQGLMSYLQASELKGIKYKA